MSATEQQPESTNGWTYYTVEEQPVEAIQDALVEADAIPSGWERETDPHVSILPGFEMPAQQQEAIFSELGDIGRQFVDSHLWVDGIECFHPLDAADPSFVVKLTVTFVSLESVRAAHRDVVTGHGGELLYEPVEAHVTLFKAGDGDDDHSPLTDDQQDRLETALAEIEAPQTIHVTGYEQDTW